MGLPPNLQPLLLVTIVLFGLYTGYELWRWLAGNRASLTPGQVRRRLTGALILEIDLVLWFLADLLMAGRPARERLLYLLAATLLTLVPMILAVREASFVLRQYAQWRKELIRGIARPSTGEDSQ